MVTPARELGALIAGGRARRLDGRPKGLLRVDGAPIIDRLADLLRTRCAALVVIGHPAGPYADRGLPVVPDRLDRGAPGGVHAALHHAAALGCHWVWTLACDLPHLDLAALTALAPHRSGRDAAIWRVDGHLQPLAACWHLRTRPTFDRLLADAAPGFRPIIDQLDVAIVDHPDPRRFADLDTPADCAAHGVTLD